MIWVYQERELGISDWQLAQEVIASFLCFLLVLVAHGGHNQTPLQKTKEKLECRFSFADSLGHEHIRFNRNDNADTDNTLYHVNSLTVYL